jgi:type I restriction enzyme R subunit
MNWVSPSEKDTASNTLEKRLWDAADQLRANSGRFSLVKLSHSLNDEQERHIREHLSEEELVIFDLLTRPAPELSPEERDEVKKVARLLLGRLKELLVINWRQKSAARSRLKLAIEDTLDTGVPRAYTPEMYALKCQAVFEHMYERYPERNAGVYAGGG